MQRIHSLDLARGFTLLCMPAVHTFLLFGAPATLTSLPATTLALIAEGPGAQLFMLLMGVYIATGKHPTFPTMTTRSFRIAALGTTLNAARFLPLYFLGWLPTTMLPLFTSAGPHWLSMLLMGDILHFAALALPLLWMIRSFPAYPRIALTLAVLTAITAPLLWDAHSDHPFINYLLQLFTGKPPAVYFPLFPWLTYPLLGLFTGYHLKKSPHKTFLRGGWYGLLATGIALLLTHTWLDIDPDGFYRTTALRTLFHAGIVYVTLYCWHLLSLYIPPNLFFLLLAWLSRHITLVYVIQWLLISWSLPLFGYAQLGLAATITVALLMTLLTILLTHTICKLKLLIYG